MKNVKLVLFLFCCFGTQLIFAQNFGLKAGVLLNDMEQKIDTDLDFVANYQPELTIGYTFGAMYRAKFNRFFSLQTELSYQQKGGRFFGTTDDSRTRFNYWDLSVVGLFKVVDDTTIDFGVGNSYTNEENIEAYEVGLIGGVSHFVSKKVVLSMRYYYGLRHLNELNFTDGRGVDGGAIKLYNRNVQLSVGYYFL